MGKLRTIMAEEGLRPKTAADFDFDITPEGEALFKKALAGLLEEAGLPPFRLDGFKNQTWLMPTPKHFESLFEQVRIELMVREVRNGLSGVVRWSYDHPRAYGAGSNGNTIGYVSVKLPDLEASTNTGGGVYKSYG